MKITLLPIALLLCCSNLCLSQDSLNMYRLGYWDDNTLPLRGGGAYSDIWGYAAAGREYAIVGSIEKIHFIDVTNPAAPVEISAMAGGYPSIWRDFKTYSHYAYAVADEGSEGLRIFNLQNLPGNVTQVFQSTAWFDQAHNIFIDEGSARLYVVGSDAPGGEDILVYDLAADPEDPTLLASVDLPGNYVHDVYVQEDTAFCSHGFTGLYVYDFTNAAAPNLLGSINTYPEDGYNHSSWLSKDKDFLVFCDESKGKGVKIMDVTDLTDLEVPSNQVFRSQLLAPTYTNSVAHNPFIKNDTLYIAYYHDGVQIFDISNPGNVTRIAYYDTEPNNTNYDWWYGAWGVYPFLPSGNIIASDILHGLQILKVGALPVPAELGVFSGKWVEEGILLEWETFSEENTETFIIEKQTEANNWTAIGQVPAAGYSSRSLHYQFTDTDALAGEHYYRLKVLDWDGKTEYSNTIVVQAARPGNLHIYPSISPTGGSLRIDYEDGSLLDLQLFDMAGKSVYSGQAPGNSSLDLAPLQLPAGTYLLQVQGPGLQHRQRLILNSN